MASYAVAPIVVVSTLIVGCVIWAAFGSSDGKPLSPSSDSRPLSGSSDKGVLDEVDEVVRKQLSDPSWSESSRAFVYHSTRSEFRAAFVANKRSTVYHGVPMLRPDVKTYSEYVGGYSSEKGSQDALVTVYEDGSGRFFVKYGKRRLPAVPYDQGILFTTGKVWLSGLPILGEKRHATLEMFILARIRREYYLTPVGTRRSECKVYRIGPGTATAKSATDKTAADAGDGGPKSQQANEGEGKGLADGVGK